jgi:pimeloyl-ACP methyl ester carboxylesterase/tetratricopeptide (TPR) repeat protein
MASKKKPPAATKRPHPTSPSRKAAEASTKASVKAPTRATSTPPPSADTSATRPEPIYGEPIEFVLPRGVDRAKNQTRSGGRGAAPPLPEGLHRGQVIHALRFTSTSRSGGEAVGTRRAEAVPGRDLVALHLGQGLKLYLHPQTAAEVLQPGALAAGKRGGGGGKRSVEVKAQLLAPSLRESSRGLGDKLGRVILEGMDIIKDAALDVVQDAVSGLVAGQMLDKAAEVAAQKAAEALDAQVVPGVYALSSDHLDNLKESQATPLPDGIPASGDLDEPILVLIHGTFSNTAGAFGALWKDHPRVVEELFDKYDDRVYGLEHPTLTVSPVINALALAQQLPEDAKVHMLTHSRGGLVAEVLACVAQDRASALERAATLNDGDREAVQALAKLVGERNIKVERIVRVACPASGTTLASKRLDAYMSVFEWTLRLAQVPVVPELVDFIATVAQYRCDDATMPGLAAQVPDSPLIKWLRGGPAGGALRVLAGDIEARRGDGEMFSILAWAKQLLSDAFYWEDNDLVVQTASMFGGGKRDSASALYALSQGPDVSHGRYFRNAESARLVSQALMSDKPSGFKPITDRQRLAEVGETKVEARSRGGRAGRRGAAVDTGVRARVPLSVRVINGNLMFAKDPLLVGHYRSSEFAGSEKAVNELIGGSMQVALSLGIYPERPGSYQLFRNTQPKLLETKLPTPPSVVVLGLGDESQLRPQELVSTVRQAVLAWAQRTYEIRSSTAGSAKVVGGLGEARVSSTLVASGGTGISPGQSAQLIVKGVDEANQLLGQINEQLKPDRRWPVLTQLVFIELYLDRASEALRALKGMPEVTRGDWIVDDVVTPGDGALRRPPDAGYRGADYDLISVRTSESDKTGARLEYALDTRRARTEMRAQSTQATLVRKLVQRASNDDNTDVQLSKTLYQLLIPRELDAYFSGSTQMRIELDDSTSGLPWEFLDPGDTVRKAEDGKRRKAEDPWAIRTRLIRKLRMADFREDVRDATQSSGILIIGEPKTPDPDLKADPPFEGYARLPGAANEARAVSNILQGKSPSGEDDDDASATLADDEDVECLIAGDGEYPEGPDAQAVVNKLLERDWKVVHIAGHGEAPISPTHQRGVVLSDGFLGPDEMRSMRIVPQLVFVNCCHLARGDDRHLMRTATYNRVDFASGVARALIETGVKCVVAAGWAVDDECAKAFATTFYRSLRAGKPFVDAVFDARKASYDANRKSNTWAAYQCYGDPEWTLNVTVPAPDESDEVLDEQRRDRFGAIASPQALVLTLEALINEAAYMRERADSQAARSPKRILGDVDYLVGTVAERHLWTKKGEVAQAIGQAYETLGQFKKAVESYHVALTAKDGGATHKAQEKFANLSIRYVEQEVRLLAERAEKAKKTAARRQRAGAKAPAVSLTKEHTEYLKVAQSMLLRLVAECLANDPRLPERLTLLASAHKRYALIALSMGQPDRAVAELKEVHKVTERAAEASRNCKTQDIYYPLLNQIVAHVALHAVQKSASPLPAHTVEEMRASLQAKNNEDPDFWSAINDIELTMYEHVALRRLAAAGEGDELPAALQIAQSLAKLNSQIQDSAKWRSVHDTARLGLGLYAQTRDHPENERRAAAELLTQIGKYAEPASR